MFLFPINNCWFSINQSIARVSGTVVNLADCTYEAAVALKQERAWAPLALDKRTRRLQCRSGDS